MKTAPTALTLLLVSNACAWMEPWAPRFERADLEPAVRREIAEEAQPVSRKFERPAGSPVNDDRSGSTNRLDRIADIEAEPPDPAHADRVSEKPE